MRTSDSIVNLAKALHKFDELSGKIGKDAINPFYKSKYASLSNILDATHEARQEAGIVIVQLPEGNGLSTRILHASGEWIEATCEIPIASKKAGAEPTPQDAGSAFTYFRRYSQTGGLNLNIDEDDDGNAASGKKNDSKIVASKINVQAVNNIASNKSELLKTVLAQIKSSNNLNELKAFYNDAQTKFKGDEKALDSIILEKDLRKEQLSKQEAA